MHWIDLLIAAVVLPLREFLLPTVLILLMLPVAAIVLRRRRQRINAETLGEEASSRAAMYAWGLLQ
jgi:hypothetical protein